MKRVLSSLVVVALVGASVVAVRQALADELVASTNGRLFELAGQSVRTGLAASESAVKQLEKDTRFALSLAPGNGQYWNTLARVHFTSRTDLLGAVVTDLDAAYAAAKASVVAQPSSAYGWASLAFASDQLMAQNRLPGGQAALEQTLSRAAALGAREPYVLRTVVDLGLANWDSLSAVSRQSVMRSIDHLAQRQPDDTIALARRRGRLAEACSEKRLASRKECTISLNTVAISS